MTYSITNPSLLTDLEQYELIVALYPDKFVDREEDDALWDEALALWQELVPDPETEEMIARLVYLTPVLTTAMGGRTVHALGTVEDGHFTAVVKRYKEAN